MRQKGALPPGPVDNDTWDLVAFLVSAIRCGESLNADDEKRLDAWRTRQRSLASSAPAHADGYAVAAAKERESWNNRPAASLARLAAHAEEQAAPTALQFYDSQKDFDFSEEAQLTMGKVLEFSDAHNAHLRTALATAERTLGEWKECHEQRVKEARETAGLIADMRAELAALKQSGDEARNKALEEAAKVADDHGCAMAAHKIRALKHPPSVKEKK
jgi:hypothetical protein